MELKELNNLLTVLISLLLTGLILSNINQNLRFIINANNFLKLRDFKLESEEHIASKAKSCGESQQNGMTWACKELENKKFIFHLEDH